MTLATVSRVGSSKFQVALPPCSRHPAPQNTITTVGPLVIVGANGAGKSRLAAWLERLEPTRCHRVAAQRTLTFPQDLRPDAVGKAEADFLYGNFQNPGYGQVQNKFIMRWPQNGNDQPLNDYQLLVRLLFSEAAQVNEEYVQRMQGQGIREARVYEQPPIRKIDVVRRIWEHVLPNRELIIGGNRIEVRRLGASVGFSPQEMSDGERVIFYLIGQCLCAPKAGVILLDEPELHLHRALQARLWDAVEAERADCLFVYLTHDLDFAASRAGGTHVWLHEYAGGEQWEWDVVPPDTAIPEALLLEVLGSRRPILFVEGKPGGSDERLYRLLYPTHHVMALDGGCSQVIHATATCRKLRGLEQLHVDACGMVDRDGRQPAEVVALASAGVAVLEHEEIENLLISEPVLRHVAAAQHVSNVEQAVTEAKTLVLGELNKDLDRLACALAGRALDQTLRAWPWKHKDGTALEQSLASHLAKLDAPGLITAYREQLRDILSRNDFEAALRVYPNKGLCSTVSTLFGVRNYAEFVLRRLGSPEGNPLLDELKKLSPVLTTC